MDSDSMDAHIHMLDDVITKQTKQIHQLEYQIEMLKNALVIIATNAPHAEAIKTTVRALADPLYNTD